MKKVIIKSRGRPKIFRLWDTYAFHPFVSADNVGIVIKVNKLNLRIDWDSRESAK